MQPHCRTCRILAAAPWLLCWLLFAAGCGTTKNQIATEQLLASDAVDRSIAHIDFSPLAGQRVYFDTRYIKEVKNLGFVNSDYIISSLRQQLFASRCLLEEDRENAEIIVEARVGTLGNDGHEINYGMPSGNNALSSAATVVSGNPSFAILPEISLARRDQQVAAAKIAVFAFQRETKEPVWQSGTHVAFSNARQTWVFGAGPFQSGTIYEAPRLAGSRLPLPRLLRRRPQPRQEQDPWLTAYRDQRQFAPSSPEAGAHAQLASQASFDGESEDAGEAESEPTTSDPTAAKEAASPEASDSQGASAEIRS